MQLLHPLPIKPNWLSIVKFLNPPPMNVQLLLPLKILHFPPTIELAEPEFILVIPLPIKPWLPVLMFSQPPFIELKLPEAVFLRPPPIKLQFPEATWQQYYQNYQNLYYKNHLQ